MFLVQVKYLTDIFFEEIFTPINHKITMMICRNFLLIINWFHNNFQGIHIHGFRKLLQENTETFIQKIPDYLVKTQNMYMFVRVERPKDSRRFVLGYVKCDLVFSFTRRFEQMRVRLNRVPPQLLMKEETEENKVLRLARLGQTDYERAMALHGDTRVGLDDVLLAMNDGRAVDAAVRIPTPP